MLTTRVSAGVGEGMPTPLGASAKKNEPVNGLLPARGNGAPLVTEPSMLKNIVTEFIPIKAGNWNVSSGGPAPTANGTLVGRATMTSWGKYSWRIISEVPAVVL